jgi:tripartite-type tricarboxylate transporter receptor subunit TctC
MRNPQKGISLVFCLLTAAVAAHAPAQDYPSRPIRMLIPFAPGGASDFVGRIIQPKLGEELGQLVVADNRAGAAGNIGVELAARAAPDGYTILLGNVGTMAINPSVFPKFPIKPLRDLTGITLIVDLPGAMGVHPSVPAATVKEFIEYAKAHPGKLSYGSTGASSAQRLAFEFFMSKAGIKLLHVPYKGGAGPATTAVLAGEVAATMVTTASFVPHMKTGRIKVLAVIAPRRVSAMPEVPTMVESGFPELTLGSWQGVFVPAGTPRPIVKKLFTAVTRTMEDAEVQKRLGTASAQITLSKSPEDFVVFHKAQNEFWAKIVKDVGATAEQQ